MSKTITGNQPATSLIQANYRRQIDTYNRLIPISTIPGSVNRLPDSDDESILH